MDSSLINKHDTMELTVAPCQPKSLKNLPKRHPIDIAFCDLSYKVPQEKKPEPKIILKKMNGCLRSGQLTAIMGPSGAGKSTLLNVLTGYKTSGMEGSITINGFERNLSHFKKLSCYIMQENQLHANLSVEESMKIAASLKLGSDVSKQYKREIILEILDTLSLKDHEKTLNKNLSGGQRKRLSVALELLNNPPVMFLDEPTSGLDSLSSFQCISLLKTLSTDGRTIICTIHQPSASLFYMFDNLYAVAEGQCIYQGNTKQLVSFLKSLDLECPDNHNPSTYLLEVACGEYGDHVKKLVTAIGNGKYNIQDDKPFPDAEIGNEESNNRNAAPENFAIEMAKNTGETEKSRKNYVERKANQSLLETLPEVKQRYPVSEFAQMWIVLKRTLLFSSRDWTLMYLRLIIHVVIGLIVGLLYYDIGNDGAKVLSNIGCLFFSITFLTYSSLTLTVLSFPREMAILLKEHFNRWYSLRAYYMAITVSDLPFQATFCCVFAAIVYWFTSQPMEWFRFAIFASSCVMISFVAQSVGLMIGAATTVANGVFLAPMTLTPFLLFSGFFINFDSLSPYIRWMSYLSYIRFSFEGVALSVYGYNRTQLDCSQADCHLAKSSAILDELNMSNSKFEFDMAGLLITFLILRLAAFIFLRWKLISVK